MKETKKEETILSKAQIQNKTNLIQYTLFNYTDSPKNHHIT